MLLPVTFHPPVFHIQKTPHVLQRKHTHRLTRSCLLFARIPARRWRYTVNFNTGILDILHGCELLSNANRPTLGLDALCLPASRSLSQREPEQSRARTYRPLLSSAGTVALYFAALAVWLRRVRLPTALPKPPRLSRVSRFSRLRRLLQRQVLSLNETKKTTKHAVYL